MAAAIEATSLEEEQLPNKSKTMTWKPRRGKPKIPGQNKAEEYFLKSFRNVCDSESEESELCDTSPNENDVSGSPVDCVDSPPHLDDWGSGVSSVPDAITFPEPQTASVYEPEDWDKELEQSECGPYDADDFYCGSFQENNLLASYSWQDDSFYNPVHHHAASLVFTPPVGITEPGQFDDADE
ncbi:PREDICTED: coordinator of PRMT5 and differentiation stimulator [Buceros rhinoceros silvestris]|uniref:coordinator of PRMT5 and differentiation stimulator n=1 Tax=Buceros rhinoceros silvestris TaxID=175836 RepID=UPI0005285F42|nr:PREDICTED: coordinator of PRMT5 and differentiation stimulator [Buceros rhinoceros silvestris]